MRVLVFGTFDHLHPGHRFLLKEAEKRACRGEAGRSRDLHVVVARDANVERIKGRLPDQNEEERLRAVREAFPRAHVVPGDRDDFLAPVREIKPDLIILGYDQCLPPGVTEDDLYCRVERLEAFEPERWKSSMQRNAP